MFHIHICRMWLLYSVLNTCVGGINSDLKPFDLDEPDEEWNWSRMMSILYPPESKLISPRRKILCPPKENCISPRPKILDSSGQQFYINQRKIYPTEQKYFIHQVETIYMYIHIFQNKNFISIRTGFSILYMKTQAHYLRKFPSWALTNAIGFNILCCLLLV